MIGKFYPPHVGHHLLIRAAAAASDRVTVLVLAHPVESIPLTERVAWLREIHRDDPTSRSTARSTPTRSTTRTPPCGTSTRRSSAAPLAEVTDEPVTAVFSSEPYGAELARRFGAIAVDVDPDGPSCRSAAPPCGPIRSPAGRACASRCAGGLARRVVVVGAESTGTTTVSLALRDALRARGGSHGLTQVGARARPGHTVEKLAADRAAAVVGEPPPAWTSSCGARAEFVAIAAARTSSRTAAARHGGPVLVCDTDAFATGIWHERYLGAADRRRRRPRPPPPALPADPPRRRAFEQDGIRDGEAIRAWMTGRFEEALAGTGRRPSSSAGPSSSGWPTDSPPSTSCSPTAGTSPTRSRLRTRRRRCERGPRRRRRRPLHGPRRRDAPAARPPGRTAAPGPVGPSRRLRARRRGPRRRGPAGARRGDRGRASRSPTSSSCAPTAHPGETHAAGSCRSPTSPCRRVRPSRRRRPAPMQRPGGSRSTTSRRWPSTTPRSPQTASNACERSSSTRRWRRRSSRSRSRSPSSAGSTRRCGGRARPRQLPPEGARTPGFVEPAGGGPERAGPGRPAARYRRGGATQLHPPFLRS